MPIGQDKRPSGKNGKNESKNRSQNQCTSTNKSISPVRNRTTGTNRKNHQNNSKPPARRGNKSQSPTRGEENRKSKTHSPPRPHHAHHHHHHHHQHYDKNSGLLPDMTVICKRSDLWDSAAHFMPDESLSQHQYVPDVTVAPFCFNPQSASQDVRQNISSSGSIAIVRAPHNFDKCNMPVIAQGQWHCDVIDTSIPNPHDPDVVHDKYWAQRRRLFSKFDQGIQLDGQGWYSVTPEIIADHVASRVAELAYNHVIPHNASEGIVILDAFCGCGGNSIAFGKIPANIISKVVCVDTDRSKLMKAAHNASLYGIPRDKLIFIECNSVFLLKHCYKDGHFILDQPAAQLPPYMPPPVMPSSYAGYNIGGLDFLPRRIDAVFMDPPWGGVDYEVFGKTGYDLQKNMKIQVSPSVVITPPVEKDEYEADGDGCDDFFDSFAAPQPKKKQLSDKARKANFNKYTEGEFIDGMELLRVAAEAVSAHVVVYDLPRNTNKVTLGKCALGAGYRGNIKLEEHYLNGRLKTVTAYMGADYSPIINSLQGSFATMPSSSQDKT